MKVDAKGHGIMRKPVKRKLMYFYTGKLDDISIYKRPKLNEDEESVHVDISTIKSPLKPVRYEIFLNYQCLNNNYLIIK